MRADVATRFWMKVEKTDGCWLWTAADNGIGYGVLGSETPRRNVLAHRLSYELHVGPIPPGMVIDHLCNNRRCVNPDHLEAVTQGVNVDRAFTRLGRRRGPRVLKTHCPQGHPYSGENLWINRNGHQVCRQCARARAAAFGRKKRAEARAIREALRQNSTN